MKSVADRSTLKLGALYHNFRWGHLNHKLKTKSLKIEKSTDAMGTFFDKSIQRAFLKFGFFAIPQRF
ncbi:MAG: hypothetical protein U9Q90_08770 [Campylobacterota bacterium]|nr:hypothetical protein [Campylobacterota bacterium]